MVHTFFRNSSKSERNFELVYFKDVVQHFSHYLRTVTYIRGRLNKFPDFFRVGTFIESTHETLVPFETISSGFNALVVPFQQLLEGPMEDLFCERVKGLRHSLFHLLNWLITTASELRE